jgi:integrase
MVSYRKNPDRLPKLTHHKASGQGVVRLNGKDVYCGPFGTAECKARYLRAIADWEANQRKPAAPVNPEPASRSNDLTVNELALAYRRFAAGYYVKNGKPTTEQRDVQLSIRPLREMFGHAIVAEFTPPQLKVVRQEFIEAGLCRNEVNKRTRRLVRMFAWGVEEGLVPSPVYWGLKAVKGIKKGREGVRESKPIRPVADAIVDATLPYLSPQVRAMVEIQRLTGMRPEEVCAIRTIDVDRSGAVWIYTPESHKTEHHGKARQIHIGPKAQEILRPWFRPGLMDYLFSPREAMEQRRAEMRRNRKTKVQPSQENRRRTRPKRAPGERYDTRSYYHAVLYGIHRANREAKKAERPEISHWHPNQLRHSAGTRIRREFGLDVARAVLGHSSPVVTEQYYAELDMGKATEAMQRLG